MISVITICYNDLVGLKKTLASVQMQSCKEIEHLIIDGGSTDGSAQFIEENKQLFNFGISEADNGVYHAMNKGIKVANGAYVFFLNSGDEFRATNVLEVFLEKTKTNKDIYYGDIQLVDGEGKDQLLTTPESLTFEFFFRRTIPHQAALIKRSLFETIFYYNESLRIVSDWEFFAVAICKENCSYEHVGLTVSNYDTNGMSSVQQNKKLFREEKELCLQRHFPRFVKDYEELRANRSVLHKTNYRILTALGTSGVWIGLTNIWLRCMNKLNRKKA